MRPEKFEPATSATDQPQTYALDHVATGIDHSDTKYSSGLSFTAPL